MIYLLYFQTELLCKDIHLLQLSFTNFRLFNPLIEVVFFKVLIAHCQNVLNVIYCFTLSVIEAIEF